MKVQNQVHQGWISETLWCTIVVNTKDKLSGDSIDGYDLKVTLFCERRRNRVPYTKQDNFKAFAKHTQVQNIVKVQERSNFKYLLSI